MFAFSVYLIIFLQIGDFQGFGAVEVDSGGVELSLIHTHQHAAFAYAGTHFDIDVLDVACDGRRDVHCLIAFEGGG